MGNKKASCVGQNAPPLSSESKQETDITGQSRLLGNLLHSWGGYVVVFVAGFIMPRVMDKHLGQFHLGIWDFSWSFVSYLSLARLDIGSSINRYVAKYRAEGDDYKLSSLITTVLLLQIITAGFVVLCTCLIVLWLPDLFGERLGEETSNARWVVGLLGLALAIRMANGTSSGIMTGYHRWDMHNIINTASRMIEVAIMWVALLGGFGLITLAIILFTVGSVTELLRFKLSRSLCPNITIRFAFFSWDRVREVVRFGMKTFIFELPPLYLVQTTNIFIVNQLGLAQLAVFARSIALVRHVETFSSKFAYILSPVAGSLQAMGRDEELRGFFLRTSQYGVAFAFPIFAFLMVNGDVVLRLWMGEEYIYGMPLAILAAGYLFPTSLNSVREVLKGLNLHGRIGIVTLSLSVICFLVGVITVNFFYWSLEVAALLVAIPLGVSLGIAPSVYACKKLKIRYRDYVRSTFFIPFVANIFFVCFMITSRKIFPDDVALHVLAGLLPGGLCLLLLYNKYIFSYDFKRRIINKIFRCNKR